MHKFLFFIFTAGLLSPLAAIADTYDALCNENDCKITINETGLNGPKGFISKDKITQWYTGGGSAGDTAGLAVATAACVTGVFCPVALAAGVIGGGKTREKLGKGNNILFTVMGKNDDGSHFVQSFRFINKKTAKKLKKDLIQLTNLQMGQFRERTSS